jgi:tetratricopeptide (TPR) repeat protein
MVKKMFKDCKLFKRLLGKSKRIPAGKDATCWVKKGLSLSIRGHYEESLLAYEQALSINPNYAGALTGKGISLRSLSRNEEALCCFDQAIEIDPGDDAAWMNRGFSQYHLRQFKEALSDIEVALKLKPQKASLWLSKGNCLYHLGRHDEALNCYDRAEAIDAQCFAELSGTYRGYYNRSIPNPISII